MQTANTNLPITVTGRHVDVSDAMRDYATKKIEGLHLDYPKIIEAKAILDVQKNRHIAEVILFCANHITIEADSQTDDMYAAIDETMSKIARRMRKHKTRLLAKKQRPRKGAVRHLEEHVFSPLHLEKEEEEEIEPVIVHKENYRIRPLFPDEAMVQLELNEEAPFVVFHNQRNDRLAILFRRKDGDYGMIEPDLSEFVS